MALNFTLDEIKSIGIYKTFHQKTAEYTLLSQYMEHSPGQITYYYAVKQESINSWILKSYQAFKQHDAKQPKDQWGSQMRNQKLSWNK